MALASAAQFLARGIALDRSDRLAGALVNAVRDGICVLDGKGLIADVNESFCTMTGFARDELIATSTPRPFWPDEQEPQLAEALTSALSGSSRDFELVYRRRNAERFPVTVTVAPVAEDGGGSEGFVCVLREVTREHREHERLREAHRVARLVSWEYDPCSGAVSLSQWLSGVGGVHLAKVTTLDGALNLFAAPHVQPLREALIRVAAGKGDVMLESELSITQPDLGWALALPEIRWIETRMRAGRDGDGTIARVCGTSQDITARKLAELAGEENKERLRQAQRMAETGSFELDHISGRLTGSAELYELFGVDADTFGDDVADFAAMIPDDDLQALRRITAATLADGNPRELEHHYERRGELRSAETRIEALGPAGGCLGVRGTMQDITERRRHEREIRLQAHLLDAVDVAVIALDLEGTVTHWNRGAERLYELTREETVGRRVVSLTPNPEEAVRGQALFDAIVSDGQSEGEIDLRHKDGTRFRVGTRSTVFHDRHGRPAGIVGVSSDITEITETTRNLRAAHDFQRAITDSMGEGLYTLDSDGRLTYINHAAQDMLGWGYKEILGRLMHDVVHFRHPDGSPSPADECPLQRPRARGESVSIDDDILICKDGSELAVQLTSAPVEVEEGIRGSVVVFTDITERKQTERRLQLEVDNVSWLGRVRDALATDRFVVYAQPIIDLTSGDTVQHELLIRMLDTSGQLILPGRFLPTAEQYGLIADIDRWMLGQAVDLAARGHAVQVNLSAHSVGAPGLVQDFQAALRRTGADPGLIVVELTETALLEDGPAAEVLIRRIREIGCKLALDDFGTGYGGFTYLKRLPFDYLKIDTEFVTDLPDNAASQQVVRAVVSLARGFGQQTVAEGVEDERTLAVLRDLDVDFAQGFAIARPAPAADVFGS